MRVVIDTNVLVSSLLTSQGKPARILSLAVNGKLIPLYDGRILAEYRQVLFRRKFGFSPSMVEPLLDYLEHEGEAVSAEPFSGPFPDEDDRKFYEVAVSGGAEALITGNTPHFPAVKLVRTPAQFLTLWAGREE